MRAPSSFAALFATLAIGMLITAVSALAITNETGTPLPSMKNGNWTSLKMIWTSADSLTTENGSPIGNGHIGAKIKGGVQVETYQLNDKTFWSGGPNLTVEDPARQVAMVNTRQILANGDIPDAENAAKGMWGSNTLGTFLPLGNLTLTFTHGNTATNYTRTLDLDQSLCTVKYTVGNVTYTRESFATFPDDVIVIRLTTNATNKVSFTAQFNYPTQMAGHASVTVAPGNIIIMSDKAQANTGWDPVKGMTAEARLKIIPQGGTVTTGTGNITVTGANSTVLIFANETSYNGFNMEPGTQGINPTPVVTNTLNNAALKTYDQLLATHQTDFRALFRRVWVDLNTSNPDTRVLGFQYARYEMISTSRLGDRPHNQQGMWNENWTPSSYSAHWLNENVEKYYGLIETANLSECGVPLWNWINELSIHGARTAQIDWGFRGWCVGQCSDIWCKTTLASGNNEWSIWPMGGVWLCNNLYDHYAFTLDKTFLANTAYPIMKGAALFCLDYLVSDGHGHLVTSPSTSPENRFGLVAGGTAYAVSVGSTMDIALIRQLFDDLIQASHVLGIDADFAAQLASTESQLLPFQIGANGELQEWSSDYSRLPNDPGNKYTPHRHASHIVTVWPLNQITQTNTPALFAAAKLALDNRGTGGYHPDKGAMYARFHSGDQALAANDSMPTGNETITGQFPPKYSAFPELLVQSHTGAIELLPALPSTWISGNVSGLKARGNYEVSITWKNGQLVSAQIDSHNGTVPIVRYANLTINLKTDPRVVVNIVAPPPNPTADDDGDGLSNLLEYTLGTDPETPNSASPYKSATGNVTVNSVSAPYLLFTFTHRSDMTSLTDTPEFSTDLQNWTTDGVLMNSTANSNNTVTETWRSAHPLTPGAIAFARLLVTEQP